MKLTNVTLEDWLNRDDSPRAETEPGDYINVILNMEFDNGETELAIGSIRVVEPIDIT